MNAQSPIVSEFETTEHAAAYEEWLKRKAAAAIADPRPSIPHEQVMAEIQAIIDKARDRQAC